MDNKGKWKLFPISDKVNIIVQIDVKIGTYVELPSQMTLSFPTQITIVKKLKKMKSSVDPSPGCRSL
jgi:hypothetical protein